MSTQRNKTGLWQFVIVALVAATVVCSIQAMSQATAITAVWANDGEDKVTQDEIRAGNGKDVTNSLWNGSTITLFGLRNEVINFNLILEAASMQASNVTVSISSLQGPDGSVI